MLLAEEVKISAALRDVVGDDPKYTDWVPFNLANGSQPMPLKISGCRFLSFGEMLCGFDRVGTVCW